jgi:CPA2 family monovalent cation:H+ antiporter-2
MEELGLVGDLAVVAVAALIGGAAARLLKLPAVLGYLAAGVVLGPHTPGPTGDITEVPTIADLGVALLMFSLGIQFSLRELSEFKGLALAGGVGVITAVVVAGVAIGILAGLSAEEAVVAGLAVSLSSSMLALRLLEDRGLIGAPAGRVAITISLVQDLSVVIMLTLLPVMGGETGRLPGELALAVLKAAALLAAVWVVGEIVLPRFLGRIAVSRSRELFLLTVVALALGTASISAEAGLSIAFGAFLAGLILSESEYAHRMLIEVFPLREVFAVVFFVAIGMLLEPGSFADDTGLVIGLALVAVFVKAGLIGAVVAGFGYPLRTALPAALALGSMGEFSFVIATQAIEEGVIGQALDDALLAAVLLSMAAAPVLFGLQDWLLRSARSLPWLRDALRPRTDAYLPEEVSLVNHAVIVGYTAVGREIASALGLRSFRYVVIDEDPGTFRELRARGIPCILGNGAMPQILEQAGTERARLLAITATDPGLVESVAATARQLNRRLHVVARGITERSHERLQLIGVGQVVHGEFEVGMQFVRHSLQRFGLTSQEVQAILMRLRRDRLGELEAPGQERL